MNCGLITLSNNWKKAPALRRHFITGLIRLLMLIVTGSGVARDTAAQTGDEHAVASAGEDTLVENGNTTPGTVVARTGNQPLLLSEIDLVLGRSPELRLPPLEPAALQTAIHLVAQQRQALQTLRKLGMAPSREQILEWIQRSEHTDDPEAWLKEKAQQWNVPASSYLEFLAFRLAWNNYLSKYLTTENMRRHFSNQAARFDGTRFLVTIVSIPANAGTSADRDNKTMQLKRWATEHQQAVYEADKAPEMPHPDWNVDHRVWIDGSGKTAPWIIDPLLEMASRDPPALVQSPSGIHAVWLHDRRPGNRSFEEASSAVRQHILVYLLDYLAGKSAEELPLQAVEQPGQISGR